jgi:hypothetical protein
MTRIHRTLMTVAIGIAMLSRSAAAQYGSSTSLTHTVSVTVPPRVKVQVGSLASIVSPTVRVANQASPAQGLALSVSATRAWVLSIGSSAATSKGRPVRWSVDAASGFSNLTSGQSKVASGTISTEPRDTSLFFRNVPKGASDANPDGSQASVVLTVTAP